MPKAHIALWKEATMELFEKKYLEKKEQDFSKLC
jgi:hypothetical protein